MIYAKQTNYRPAKANDYVTIVQQACDKVTGFTKLYQDLERSINVSCTSKSPLTNYGPRLAYLALNYHQLSITRDSERLLDYLSFVKSKGSMTANFLTLSVYGLRSARKLS